MLSLRAAGVALAATALTIVGCHRSFTALDRDGGSTDAGATDARTPGPDAHSPDGGGCPEGAVVWIDRTPLMRPIRASPEPALAASTEGFELFYWSGDPLPCDACAALTRIPTRGDVVLDAPHLAYWGGTDASRLIAQTAADGSPWFAVVPGVETNIVRWAGAPDDTGRWFEPSGQTTEEGTIGDVLLLDSTVLVQSHVPAGRLDPVPQLEGLRVRELSLAGTEVVASREDDLDPNHGFEFWSPQLARDPSGPWLAMLSNVDFPPSVVMRGPAFAVSWEGSSCGVDSYEMAPESGSSVLITEDCGSMLQVTRRRDEGERESTVITGTRGTAAPTRSRLVARDDRVVVAYREADGAVRIAATNRALEIEARSVVPGSEVTTMQSPGPLALAAHADGTFAVAWTRMNVEDGVVEHGAVQRFRFCE